MSSPSLIPVHSSGRISNMGREGSESWVLGGSLPVENVQALASNKPDRLPDRYIRTELELQHSELCLDAHDQQIPVIDLSRLLTPHCSEDELKKLDTACQEWGFFHLINHGVPVELMERLKDDVKHFFGLALEEKNAYAQLPGHLEGYGQAFVRSEEQKLDWGDMLFLVTGPIAYRKMRFWPTNPTTFRETVDKHSEEMHRLAICLMQMIAKNLGVEPKKLTDMLEDQTQSVRMNYYPPCRQADKVFGISPHSDATCFSFLLQANEVQGFQIRKNGKWVPIKPIPNAYLTNVGDIIEIMSNGKYKSVEHMATVDKEKERISVVSFSSPNAGAMVEPLEEVVKEKVLYTRLSYREFRKLNAERKLDGKNLIAMLKLPK